MTPAQLDLIANGAFIYADRDGKPSPRCPMTDTLGGVVGVEEPVRVQLSRKKGWRMPPNTVKVDRTNKTHGNIFKIGCNPRHFSTALPDHCDSVEQAIECFRYYAETWMALTGGQWARQLVGKNLACWCQLDAPCHADVLLELANGPRP